MKKTDCIQILKTQRSELAAALTLQLVRNIQHHDKDSTEALRNALNLNGLLLKKFKDETKD